MKNEEGAQLASVRPRFISMLLENLTLLYKACLFIQQQRNVFNKYSNN